MYEKFLKIDGTHPWRDVSPEGYVDYPVRFKEGGRVLFFNFVLAKEMELIPLNHPSKMNSDLEEVIFKTFSLQILNEYDWLTKDQFPRDGYEHRLYMATRYLQSQHKNKRGETSGDGRSIWNGCIRSKIKTFDISSCGTGTTILSPGVQEAGRFIKTGDNSYGYACGLADLDEMLGAAIMSEIFYREGIPTERCLAVIGFKNKTAIGVRSAPNLIRPAHIFRYLKLGYWKELENSFEYFIGRQEENKVLKLPKKGKKRYTKALEYIAKIYARLAAILEEEYIFSWLAWDGDNMLASGALLDYGSIRRFAAKHTKYRYEDMDRFSSCLSEQRYEARRIVQVFAQVIDFILTRKKKSLEHFRNDKSLLLFDQCFIEASQRYMLRGIGFSPQHVEKLIKFHRDKVRQFKKVINYFEEIKTTKGQEKLPDGIDHPPVFLIRHILRELPIYIRGHLKKEKQWPVMPSKRFCKIMAGSYVNKKDLRLTKFREQKAYDFQQLYKALICAVSTNIDSTLEDVIERSRVINYPFRTTGDGLIQIVDVALKHCDTLNQNEFMGVIERFIQSQTLVPKKWKPLSNKELKGLSRKSKFLRRMFGELKLYKELI